MLLTENTKKYMQEVSLLIILSRLKKGKLIPISSGPKNSAKKEERKKVILDHN